MESWTVPGTRHVMHPEEVQNCIVIPHTLGSQCSVQRVVVMGHVVCSAPFEARVRCCAQMLQSHTKQAGKAAQQQHGDASDARTMRAQIYMRVEDPDLAILEKMPSAMPNCWRPVFLIFFKKIRMENQFAKLLEMLLITTSR